MKTNTTTYQGWSNRSTFLANLHLHNTNFDLYTHYLRIIIASDTKAQFKKRVTVLISNMSELLNEEGFNIKEVDFKELLEEANA